MDSPSKFCCVLSIPLLSKKNRGCLVPHRRNDEDREMGGGGGGSGRATHLKDKRRSSSGIGRIDAEARTSPCDVRYGASEPPRAPRPGVGARWAARALFL